MSNKQLISNLVTALHAARQLNYKGFEILDIQLLGNAPVIKVNAPRLHLVGTQSDGFVNTANQLLEKQSMTVRGSTVQWLTPLN